MPDGQDRKLTYILPIYADSSGALSWTCAKNWCAENPSQQCGCPDCLGKVGLTLVYDAVDMGEKGMAIEIKARRIVSIRTGRLAPHLICPHYPGYESVEDVEPNSAI